MLQLHYAPNTISIVVAIALNEGGVHYQPIRVDFASAEQTKPAYRAINPKARVPALATPGGILTETGAIIEYILRVHGDGKFIPEMGTKAFRDYQHFIHFAEGSAMLPLLLALYNSFLGEAGAPLHPVIMTELKGILDYCEYHLTRNENFAGEDISGADFMMIFPLEAANARGRLKGYEACQDWLTKMHARPAYLRALERGGEYAYGPKS